MEILEGSYRPGRFVYQASKTNLRANGREKRKEGITLQTKAKHPKLRLRKRKGSPLTTLGLKAGQIN